MANEITPTQDQAVQSSDAGAEAPSAGSQPAKTANFQSVLLRNRRLLLVAASILTLMGFIGLVMWSADPPYRPLFSGISEQEASSVVDTLQKEHIPYRLDGATTILVPADQVYAVRLKLASKGAMPANGVGYELFDQNTPFGISNFTQKVNLQRALQGELARTIEILPQVAKARVQLVLTKESAFVDRQRQASASVMLQLAGGQHIPKQTILAIQNLVSASVPDLKPEAVTLVDSAGNLLSSKGEQTAMSAGQSQHDYQVKFERRMEERLAGMLEQLVGPGQAVVRVTADIDREQVEQSSKRYNPDEAVLRNQRVIDENRVSADAIAAGVPGTASNTPGNDATTQQAQPKEQAKHSERISNYEISSTTEKRIIPSGTINRLSVAAIVGGSFKEENGKSVFVPKSKQELNSIRNLLESAMGYDEDRGDTLEVQSMPLVDVSSHADTQALKAAEQKSFYLELARYGVAGLALLLLAWFVLRPMAKRITTQHTAANQVQHGIGLTPEDLASDTTPLPALSEASPKHLEWQEVAKELVTDDPTMAAKILHQWTQQT